MATEFRFWASSMLARRADGQGPFLRISHCPDVCLGPDGKVHVPWRELVLAEHKFAVGTQVNIIGPSDISENYAHLCHLKTGLMFLAEKMATDFGKPDTIKDQDHDLECHRLVGSGYWWHIGLLLPVSDTPKADMGLDQILASLYDRSRGKDTGQDTAELLESYRAITGKDRPGFMR